MKSDKYAEDQVILGPDDFRGSGRVLETTTLISPLGGATQLNNGGIDSASSAGLQAGGQLYSKRLLERLDKDPFYVRVPAGTTFYLYVTQTVDLGKATVGLRFRSTATQPDSPMKSVHAIILLSLFAGCATRKEVRSVRPTEVPGTLVAAAELPEIRTPETVKAYPVGRYTDPNFPDGMHERHTLYRREQNADWNYHPSQPQALPLGPVTAVSTPSPSYYAKTNAQQINAQQKAYAEALLEQNRVMKERIDALQKNESAIHSLQSEVERLRKELDFRKESAPAAEDKADFSFWRAAPDRAEDEISDPGEIILFPRSEADCQAFLVSQIRLNDELAKALDAFERRKMLSLLQPLFPSRAYLALITNNAP